MTNDVWVFIEIENEKLSNSSIALINEGKRLSDKLGGNLKGVLIGPHIEDLGLAIGNHGLSELFYFCEQTLVDYYPEIYDFLLTELILKEKPYLLLSVATSLGSDLLPRISAKTQSPLITNCIEIKTDDEIKFIKAVHNGRLHATIACKADGTKMVTMSPEAMVIADEGKAQNNIQVNKLEIQIDEVHNRIDFKGFLKADHKTIDICEAESIVAIGKGIGSKEKFHIYEKLADLIGAAIGGSRQAVDLGIIPFERQIGQTGKEISPKLIVLCGISGAPEFTKGIEGAGAKLAINTDRNASVFKDVTLGVVGDVNTFASEFTEYLNNELKK